MNRRDFIGAAIGALIAALVLPFEEFAAWARAWLTGERLREVAEKMLYEMALAGQLGVPYAFEEGETLTWNEGAQRITGRITKVDRLRRTITVESV